MSQKSTANNMSVKFNCMYIPALRMHANVCMYVCRLLLCMHV